MLRNFKNFWTKTFRFFFCDDFPENLRFFQHFGIPLEFYWLLLLLYPKLSIDHTWIYSYSKMLRTGYIFFSKSKIRSPPYCCTLLLDLCMIDNLNRGVTDFYGKAQLFSHYFSFLSSHFLSFYCWSDDNYEKKTLRFLYNTWSVFFY